jgi:hypothetical protein
MNNDLKRFEIDIRVGDRELTWTRFAPDAVALIVDAQAACRHEWPGDASVITGYREIMKCAMCLRKAVATLQKVRPRESKIEPLCAACLNEAVALRSDLRTIYGVMTHPALEIVAVES